MKKIVLILLFVLIAIKVEAAEIFRNNFYDGYDPASTSFVYDDSGSATTGEVVAVNTYLQKSIQITGVEVGENIQIRIEGRSLNQINPRSRANSGVANWAVLDTVNFGAASEDSSINQIVDVTEYVDFLRVGIRQGGGTAGTSAIDVEGIFTNIER